MSEKKQLTAEDFMKHLENFPNTCASCKYFERDRQISCTKRSIEVESKTSRCDEWRYAF